MSYYKARFLFYFIFVMKEERAIRARWLGISGLTSGEAGGLMLGWGEILISGSRIGRGLWD